jgi:D-amino-acid dehydrogenase
MRVIVVGAGIIGVTTAYELAADGVSVAVVDRRAGVAQETSFGNAGVIAPGYVTPWAAPGMPGKVLSYLFKANAPVVFRPSLEPRLWRWLVAWLGECRAERWRTNKLRMQRLAFYSRDRLHLLRARHGLQYEQSQGYLQLLRSDKDLAMVGPARALLEENGVPCQLLDAQACRTLEPGLSPLTPLAGGLHLPEDESGNCPVFAAALRRDAEALGARFRLDVTVHSLVVEGGRVIGVRIGRDLYKADAVIVCAGADSVALLDPVGVRVPIWPVKGYAATVTLKPDAIGPGRALMDEAYKTAITPFGNRLRIAGTAEISDRTLTMREAPLRTLIKVAGDWFPAAARWSEAQYWVGARPMLPDGPPLLGATALPGLYLNLGHGSTGWAMACGSARVLADLVTGKTPQIDLDGLTLQRYRRPS